jgi:hypothetical protein
MSVTPVNPPSTPVTRTRVRCPAPSAPMNHCYSPSPSPCNSLACVTPAPSSCHLRHSPFCSTFLRAGVAPKQTGKPNAKNLPNILPLRPPSLDRPCNRRSCSSSPANPMSRVSRAPSLLTPGSSQCGLLPCSPKEFNLFSRHLPRTTCPPSPSSRVNETSTLQHLRHQLTPFLRFCFYYMIPNLIP